MYLRKKEKIDEKPLDLSLIEQNAHVSRNGLDLQTSGQTIYVIKKSKPIYHMNSTPK